MKFYEVLTAGKFQIFKSVIFFNILSSFFTFMISVNISVNISVCKWICKYIVDQRRNCCFFVCFLVLWFVCLFFVSLRSHLFSNIYAIEFGGER